MTQTIDADVLDQPEAEQEQVALQPPRAAWPDPKNANFTLERRSDPFNPGERHEGLRRRSTDKD